MNILSEFGSNLKKGLSIARRKLGFDDDTAWENAKRAFIAFGSYEKVAGYQLPLLRQIMITSNTDFLAVLRLAFAELTMVEVTDRCSEFDEAISYSGSVGRIISDPALRKLITGAAHGYSFELFGEEDYIRDDEDSLAWYSEVLERHVPKREYWWVVPKSDISTLMTDIDELRDILGLFCYTVSPPPLCLIIFESSPDLYKSNCLHAQEYPGFWPSTSEWGQTVNVRTHLAGVREAIHYNKSPIGPNQLLVFPPPNPRDPRWKEYCESRAQILEKQSTAHTDSIC